MEDTFLEAGRLADGCDDAQWVWTPSPGVWSAAGCIAHLNQTNREYVTAIRSVLESGNPERSAATDFRYGVLERWFVKSMEPPVKIKLKAPKVFVPLAVDSKEAAMAEWQRIHLELTSLIERSEPLHLTKNKVISPAVRLLKISLGMAFALIAAHNRRHLYQAREMIGRAPRSAAT